jgi:hypothetical protein
VKQSRVFVRILGRLPRRGVYPELTEGLLAMTLKVFLEVPITDYLSGTAHDLLIGNLPALDRSGDKTLAVHL